MASTIDLTFGEIAVKTGMVTKSQVDECLKIQQDLPEWKTLGLILRGKDYLTPEQFQIIINLQKRNIKAQAIQMGQIKEDNIFGRVAMKLGLVTETKVDECMGMQLMMRDDYLLKLGEIMVKKGYLSTAQVHQILDYQESRLINCPQCQTRYNVVLFNPDTRFLCYKCETELQVPPAK